MVPFVRRSPTRRTDRLMTIPGFEDECVTICDGCLVVHRDGTTAYCSEELDDRPCQGYDTPHLAGLLACRLSPRWSRCPHCDSVMRRRLSLAPTFVPDGLYVYTN